MRRPLNHHSTVIGISIVFLLVAAFGQGRIAKKSAAPAIAAAQVEAPAPNRESKYQSGKRRDPFLNPLLLKKRVEIDEEVGLGQAPLGIAGTFVAQAALIGISRSADSKTAVFRGADKRAYFLQEGDHLFDGYLTKIEPESVTLVRETRYRSGKVQTEQVVKRLRTP
jgi:hypothetical protein